MAELIIAGFVVGTVIATLFYGAWPSLFPRGGERHRRMIRATWWRYYRRRGTFARSMWVLKRLLNEEPREGDDQIVRTLDDAERLLKKEKEWEEEQREHQ